MFVSPNDYTVRKRMSCERKNELCDVDPTKSKVGITKARLGTQTDATDAQSIIYTLSSSSASADDRPCTNVHRSICISSPSLGIDSSASSWTKEPRPDQVAGWNDETSYLILIPPQVYITHPCRSSMLQKYTSSPLSNPASKAS